MQLSQTSEKYFAILRWRYVLASTHPGKFSGLRTKYTLYLKCRSAIPRYGKEPWFSRGLRLVTVDHYNIYYLVDKERNSVSIMRILYGRRNMESVLSETE